jgi:predicted ArsR family transcriptional regulator
MNQYTDSPMPDADMRRALLKSLSEHGPMRSKALTKRAGTPYERSVKMLESLRAEGVVEQVPGGTHRGLPTFAWKMKGDARGPQGAGVTFSAQATLAAMQAAARSFLTGQAA